MPFSSRDQLLGVHLDGWHLQSHLGRGNMGQLYRGVREDGSVAAVKVLHRTHVRDPELLERFAREFENTARIRHRNVVAPLGWGRAPDGAPYLALEYLEGQTLDEVIEADAPLSTLRTVRIGVQIAKGLAAAHAVDVVHRDLKPENVMVLAGDRIKLFDFGLARAKVPDQPRLTAQDMRLGTPMFMAPEYIARGTLDHRSDLYALGMLLFELCTGTEPFEGPAFKILHLQVTQVPARADTFAPNVHPALCDLIAHLLQKDPDARPQDAAQVAATLAAID